MRTEKIIRFKEFLIFLYAFRNNNLFLIFYIKCGVTVIANTINNFRNIKLEDSAVKDYERALEIEKKGIEHYKKQFAETKDQKTKDLYDLLIKQESYHLKTVENILDMVRKPEWWVENAEFTPKGDDYY